MRPKWSGLHAGLVNPPVCGRKFCGACGRWRLLCDFRVDKHKKYGLRSECITCQRRRSNAKWANQTPEERAIRYEYFRIYHEGKRRENGVPRRGPRNKKWNGGYVFLDIEPLSDVLRERVDEQRIICSLSGVSERAVYRLMVRESKHVRMDVADKLCIAMGFHLSDLYPDGVPVYRRTINGRFTAVD